VTGILTRTIPRAGLALSHLGFGGAPLGNLFAAVTDDDATATVEAAVAGQITYLDTAPFYGFGLSEERLGRAVARVGRDKVVLSTKVGRLLQPTWEEPASPLFVDPPRLRPVFDYSYDGTLRSLEESCRRLGTDRVEIAIIHDCSPRWHGDAYEWLFEEAMTGAYRALAELRAAGQVEAIGVGVNNCAVCLDFADAGRFDLFMLAGRYTLLDDTGAHELFPRCLADGIGILLAGPFNSGILATGAAAGATYFYAEAPPEILARTRAIEEVCAGHGVALPAAALQFTAAHPAVTSVVTGARSPAEIAANLGHWQAPIPAAFWAELEGEGLIAEQAPVPT
jgi:D-threo-aldose 1-dehydrogenase